MVIRVASMLEPSCEYGVIGVVVGGGAEVCNGGSLRLGSWDECSLPFSCRYGRGGQEPWTKPRDCGPSERGVYGDIGYGEFVLLSRHEFALRAICGLNRRRFESGDRVPFSSHCCGRADRGSTALPTLIGVGSRTESSWRQPYLLERNRLGRSAADEGADDPLGINGVPGDTGGFMVRPPQRLQTAEPEGFWPTPVLPPRA